jgi:hypothetical protein
MAENKTAGMSEAEIDKAKAFMKFMGRHLVVMTGLYESYKDGKLFHTGIFAFSGFILNLHDRIFWITAGHCLADKFDVPIKDGTLKILTCGFADYFGDKVINADPIPYSYAPGNAFYIDDDTRGLDFAAIPLPDLTVKALIANGVKAIGRENWISQTDLTFEHYKIMGVPTHLTECQVSPSGRVVSGIQPAMITIDRVDPNSIPGPLPDKWFVGQIPDDVKIQSIEGMSGGPIYGFRQKTEGQWLYYVVALQSRWRLKERITFGCSAPLFAEMLYETVGEILGIEKQPEEQGRPQMASRKVNHGGKDYVIEAVPTTGGKYLIRIDPADGGHGRYMRQPDIQTTDNSGKTTTTPGPPLEHDTETGALDAGEGNLKAGMI